MLFVRLIYALEYTRNIVLLQRLAIRIWTVYLVQGNAQIATLGIELLNFVIR